MQQPGGKGTATPIKDRDTLIEQLVTRLNKRSTQNNRQTSSLWQIYEANKDSEI